MDYNRLAVAFSENNSMAITQYVDELRPRLIRFLHIHLNASPEDAEDCTQEAFLTTYETIKTGKMRDAEHLLSFLLSACRNNYLNLKKKRSPQLVEESLDERQAPPRQLSIILDKEKHALLAQCIEKLNDGYRTFINYWFSHPDAEAIAAAEHFGMSTESVWTKKHRIVKKLSECYQKKLK